MISLDPLRLHEATLVTQRSLALVISHTTAQREVPAVAGPDAARVLLRRLLFGLRVVSNEPGREAGDIFHSASHARGYSLIALSLGEAIGCDIENRFLPDDSKLLAPLVLDPTERRELDALDSGSRHESFMRTWVCKESILKSMGTGFSADPKQAVINADTGRDAKGRSLYLHTVAPAPNCMAGVASSDPVCSWFQLTA